MTTLDQAAVGDRLVIQTIRNPQSAIMALRLGIAAGEQVELAARIPGGPLVIQRGALQIALGRDICKDIEVHLS